MANKITVSLITRNADSTLEETLKSVYGWVLKIVIADAGSTDKTLEIAQRYKAITYSNPEKNEGKQRLFCLNKVKSSWILVLDSDEIVTSSLKQEIIKVISNKNNSITGYRIPFQNFFLGKPLHYGGENYSKMILFKKSSVFIKPDSIHAVYEIKNGSTGELKNKIFHYSYQSVPKLYSKFTSYAWRLAKQKKLAGERTSLKKIILYPVHMFWARFFHDKGYKDGIFRIPLDLAFAYMEFMTYFLMLFAKNSQQQNL